MKKNVLIAFFILILAILCTGCIQNEYIEEDGGLKDTSNYNVPKFIVSTEITDFICEFSTASLVYPDLSLKNGIYKLSTCIENNIIKGHYEFYSDEESITFSFQSDTSFLDTLDALVKDYELANYNGRTIFVNGLPDMYGAYLNITYGSGENIYASDNQDNFLSLEFMEELNSLFQQQNANLCEDN